VRKKSFHFIVILIEIFIYLKSEDLQATILVDRVSFEGPHRCQEFFTVIQKGNPAQFGERVDSERGALE